MPTTIFNLAGALKLRSVTTEVIPNFAALLALTNSTVLATCCPGIFHRITDTAWVFMKYKGFTEAIDKYKQGHATSEQFLEEMLKIFYFLVKDDLEYDAQLTERLFKKKEEFFILKGIERKEQLIKPLIAKALLEEAWNTLIVFDDVSRDRFRRLIECAKTDPVYLIANTNELNIHIVLYHVRKAFPEINWCEEVTGDLKDASGDVKPIQLAPNLYLYPSHLVRCYKSDGLIRQLVAHIRADGAESEIELISQWRLDLDAARDLHLTSIDLTTFFSTEISLQSRKYQV